MNTRTTSERALLRSDFFCRKISHTLRRSSFFAKSHAQFACLFVNALVTAHNRYQLFTILRLRRSQNPLLLLRLRASPVRTLAPRRNGLCSVPIFLCGKISHALRLSSSFVKSHAQFACSFVNALATAHNRYQLFTIFRLRRSQNPMSLLRLRASPVRTLAPNEKGPS